MTTTSTHRILTALLLAFAFLLPISASAQGDGGKKKRKTHTTTQTTPAKKPGKKQPGKKPTGPTRKATVSNPDGQIAGHGYVDLGLPSGLKWATCNVGASSLSDYGSYFAWGETSTKSSYTTGNSLTRGKDISKLRSEGIIGSNGNLTMSHDAASYNWGSSWRMPTKAECQELVDRCTWTWTTHRGTKGYIVTGRNGKSIFLPCAGWRSGSSLSVAGEYGYYWSSTPDEENSISACRLVFGSGYHYIGWDSRYLGFSVRPVAE